MSDNVLVLGATSGIARELCHLLAARGCCLVVASRNCEELEKCAADLRLRYQVNVVAESFDALDFEGHPAFFSRCLAHLRGRIDGVILCHGYLPVQAQTQVDFAEARRTLDVNLTSAVSLLSLAANYLENQKKGYLVAISSVAGDRGRQSNYTYGAAKAGLTTYLEGLRNRLHKVGVRVLTIKPGMVDTPMTHGLINAKSPLVASPARVARDIERAIRKQRDVTYTPWFWSVIMRVIRAVPGSIFKRLKL
jgi:decaprenylphospho-beta-D-erythro-pentofuranosid-2-ulose 2-reductase